MKSWKPTITIPHYMILNFTDMGIEETYDNDNKRIDSDDLRIAIELSTRYHVILPDNGRIIIDDEGNIIIEQLMEMAE